MSFLGIPLIFKDAKSTVEAAGQTRENEIEINREPMLFSFNNPSRNTTCVMRVGTGLHHYQDGRPQWSQQFSFENDLNTLQLKVRSSHNSFEWSYSISIDIHHGNSHTKRTKFIFLNPRYMICNQCSYDLLIVQRDFVNDESKWLHVLRGTNVGFHWSRTDIERLVCVRIMYEYECQLIHWSGSFQIDNENAFHINMRYNDGQCLIVRVQIIEKHGTYFVVFLDSNQIPVPFRICNKSDVPIQFYQTEIRENLTHLRTILLPYQSIDYTWDEPTLKRMITCSVINGSRATYDLLKLGPADDLYYQNCIYLAFQSTFKITEKSIEQLFVRSEARDALNSSSQNLVIEYSNDRLFLAQRQENRRSQLWQMTSNGLLIHVGSAPFQDLNSRKGNFNDIRQALVLDIKEAADNNLRALTTYFIPLTVRCVDQKRALTQTWQFLDSGYVCMANTQMCIQVFGELKENSDVVLGPIM